MKKDIITCMEAISRLSRLQMNIKRDLPIRASEMGTLIYIEKNDKTATPLMISNFFGIAKPSATDMINSLIKNNYLTKIPSKIDKRSYTLELTPKGHELIKTTYNEYFRSIEILKKRLGNEKFKLFVELLKETNNILSEV